MLYALDEEVDSNKVNSQYSVSSPFELTPVQINGYEAVAMVDTGANPSFISLNFCQQNNIKITPDITGSTISRGGINEKKYGTVKVAINNGIHQYKDLTFTVLPHINFDLIIGRNFHQKFGYRLVGVPTQLPGPAINEPDNLIPHVSLDDIKPVPVTYPPLIAALQLNSQIDLLKPCTHPLAKWDLSFTKEPTYWSRRNYLSNKDEPKTDKFVELMLRTGNISVAPPNPKM
jgi:hypothetical protein